MINHRFTNTTMRIFVFNRHSIACAVMTNDFVMRRESGSIIIDHMLFAIYVGNDISDQNVIVSQITTRLASI